jgi:hypothetical protein
MAMKDKDFPHDVSKEVFEKAVADQNLELNHDDEFAQYWVDWSTGLSIGRVIKPYQDDLKSKARYSLRYVHAPPVPNLVSPAHASERR